MSQWHKFSVDLGALVAWACYLAGFGLIFAGMFEWLASGWAELGLGVTVLGNMVTMMRLSDRLHDREAAAYDLGRKSVRNIR